MVLFGRRDKKLECARVIMDMKNIIELLKLAGEDKKKLKTIRKMIEDAEYDFRACPTDVRERLEILSSQIKSELKKKTTNVDIEFAEKILEKELKKLLEI